MNSKTHRQNHDFQIAHFLAGSCHTADGAYALLCDLKEDREVAIRSYEASQIRLSIKKSEIEKKLKSWCKNTRLSAQADLAEIQATEPQSKACYDAALAEYAFIQKCIDAVQPHRKFSHLPDSEAHEAAQFDEWKFELISRAENALLTIGTIPTDHFATMRMHPAFKDEIMPAIENIKQLIATNRELLMDKINERQFYLPSLLEVKNA